MERVKGVWLKVFKGGAVSALLMAIFFLLSSCGGGGGGVTPTTPAPSENFQLSGMIASGAPLQTSVKFRDGNGNFGEGVTDADGNYTNIDLTAQGLTPPVLIRILNPLGGWLYSYASKSGRANVHPLTDPIIRAWYRVKYPAGDLDADFLDDTANLVLPTQNEINFIKAVVMDLIKNLLTAVAENVEEGGLTDAGGAPVKVEDFDPMETSFTANGAGFDKILDDTTIDTSEDTGTLKVVVEPNSDLEDDVENTGGSTMYTIDTSIIVQTDTEAPVKPDKPTAAQVSDTQVLVTWGANPVADEVAYYKISKYKNGISTGTATATSTSFIFPNLEVGQSYTFSIFACDGSGNYSEESDLSDPVPIVGETNIVYNNLTYTGTVKATLLDYNEIMIAWSGFLDGDGIIYYNVYSCDDDQGTNQDFIGKVQGDYFIQLNLAPDTYYCYVVRAVDAAETESDGVASCVRTDPVPQDRDDEPPAAPTGFEALATTPNQIELTWTAPAEDDLAGYYIYRDIYEIDEVEEGALSYTDTGLDPNTTYNYEIKAYDLNGNLSAGVQDSAKTPPAGQLPDVTELIDQAKDFLEAQNIPLANARFKSAYMINSEDKNANFGLAITDLVMLLEDSEVVKFLSNYETYKPTIDNIVYGALNNTYQVWGGNSPLCGDEALDPNSHGYIKLSDGANPVTNFSDYSFYVIYTPPFSEIDVTVSGDGISRACEWWWETDQISEHIGGGELFGDSLTIYASNGMSLSVQNGVQQRALIKKVRGKFSATDVKDDDEAILVNEIKSLFNKLPKNKISLSTRLKRRAKSLLDEPPTPSEVQALINSTLLPTISGVISKLRAVEGSGYTFTITTAMTGGAEEADTVLDDGEFYALDAMFSLLKGIMNILTAYDLDFDCDIIEYDPLSQINNSTFFTLKSDGAGATKMANALTSLQDVVDKAESAYTFIFNEWGYDEITVEGCAVLAPTNTVTDNGIQLHDEDSSRTCEYGGLYNFTPKDDTDIKNGLNAAQMVLAGQVTYKEEVVDSVYDDGTNTIIFETEEVNESDGVKFSVVFDVTKFFTNPLDKTDLPTFGYDLPIDVAKSQAEGEPMHLYAGPDGDEWICCDIYMTSDLPDYTLNGIFPAGIPEFTGFHIFESAVVLDKQTWGGWDWSRRVASDGTSIYLYKKDYQPEATSGKIWKIDPSTGYVTDTYNLNLNYLANGICWIDDITWHNGALWASGGYGDATDNMTKGIYQINLGNGQSLNQIPADPGLFWHVGSLASDGTSLYVWGELVGGDRRLVKFNPNLVAEVPTTPFFSFDENPWQVVYGGDYLWLQDGTLKVDPSNGNIVKEYGHQGWINAYLNGKLYSVNTWDKKIHVFKEPGT